MVGVWGFAEIRMCSPYAENDVGGEKDGEVRKKIDLYVSSDGGTLWASLRRSYFCWKLTFLYAFMQNGTGVYVFISEKHK